VRSLLGTVRRDAVGQGRIGSDWTIITQFSPPSPDRFVRNIPTFLPNGGSWRRESERHENTLIDTSQLLVRLAALEITAEGHAFGDEALPEGLYVVTGTRDQ
jgi:hypothetical protein